MSAHAGFIASVGDDNVTSATKEFPWFILRAQRRKPYNSLQVGAPLYWYDPAKRSIFLLTRLTKVEQLEYETVDQLREWLAVHYGDHGSADPYFVEKAEKRRYCVAFWVRPIQELDLPKPQDCKFEQDGWLPCNSDVGRRWLSALEALDPDGRAGPSLRSTTEQLTNAGYFDPTDLRDRRDRTLQEVVQRRGQPEFRRTLINVYGSRCAISQCDAVAALEAAHITPYLGPQSNHPSNGLLLRADLHTLFDLDLLGIAPDTLQVALSPSLEGTSYEAIRGKVLATPADLEHRPNLNALRSRWQRFS